MKKMLGRRIAASFGAAVGAGCLLLVTAAPASAASAAVAVVQGSGTISPGVTAIPTNQSYTFNSVAITTVGVVNTTPSIAGVSQCTSSGSTLVPENYAVGAGQGVYSCSSGPLAGRNGTVTYVRVGAAVPVVLTGGLAGALACAFTANQTPPAAITSYGLACAGAGAAAN